MTKLKRVEAVDFIDTRARVAEFEHRLRRAQVMFIGYDTEYDPSATFDDNRNTENIRKRRPLLLSLAVVTRDKGENRGNLVSQGYVFDLRNKEVHEGLRFLGKNTAKMVAHAAETDLITLFACGIAPNAATFYDTFLAEKSLEMGLGHPDLERELIAIEAATEDPAMAEILVDEYEREYFEKRYSLVRTAKRYGITHRNEHSKERLQQSFIAMPEDQNFTQEQIDYAFEDAHVTSEIYLAQAEALVGAGSQSYLEQVVFPLIPHLAKSQWDGMRVATAKLQPVYERTVSCKTKKNQFMRDHYGIENFNSNPQKRKAVENLGLIHLVTERGGGVSLNKEKIKSLAPYHQYFKDHAEMSHLVSTQSSIEKIQDLTDEGGFLHPRFHQLQAKTGRITTTRPSPFDKKLRPIIVPSKPGYGIFEIDVGQAEVWLIACMSGDLALQRACNNFDIYLRLGAELVPAHFDRDDLELILAGPKTDDDLKQLKLMKEEKYKNLRQNLLKALILAILYGQTPRTVARKTKQQLSFIHSMFAKLRVAYPDLFKFIDKNIKYGSARGYIELSGGFRIHVSGSENEINRLRNNPIQGMCAVLFNRALLQTYEAVGRYRGRVLLPLYDAVVVEGPLEFLSALERSVQEIFTNVFQRAFPDAIAPVKLDVNDSEPSCWNDHGASNSLDEVPVKPMAAVAENTPKS